MSPGFADSSGGGLFPQDITPRVNKCKVPSLSNIDGDSVAAKSPAFTCFC